MWWGKSRLEPRAELEPEEPDPIIRPREQPHFGLTAQLSLIEFSGKAAVAALPQAEPVTELRRAAVSEQSEKIKSQHIQEVERLATVGGTRRQQKRGTYITVSLLNRVVLTFAS